MNTEITVHPKLQYYGLITANLDAMIEWYRKVLGMAVNRRSAPPAGGQNRPPFSAFAFISNDEMDHRIMFFEMPGESRADQWCSGGLNDTTDPLYWLP